MKDEETSTLVTSPGSPGLALRQGEPGASVTYLLLPVVFLLVTLLGGFRLGGTDNSFIFLKPALICLVFAAVLMVLFVRTGLVRIRGWFSHSFSGLKNTVNALVLLTLFTASVQLFNAVLPEQGLPFWVVSFCFAWSLWTNLFAEFAPARLVRSLAALFGFAFVTKYLVLANLTAPAGNGWLQGLIQDPTKQAFTWLLDLPGYGPGTGYVQFFTVTLYTIGLLLTPRET